MDDKSPLNPQLNPKERNDWIGINFLLQQVEPLQGRGLITEDAGRAIVADYTARREAIERQAQFVSAMAKVQSLRYHKPAEALSWAERAGRIDPNRPEAWIAVVELHRRLAHHVQANTFAAEAIRRFPELEGRLGAWKSSSPTLEEPTASPVAKVEPTRVATVEWSSVTGEFLKEHWQKLISALAVLLIVVSSTVGAQVLLGPRLWSPSGKCVLALVFTWLCGGFGLGLVRWGAARAGQMMLVATLIVVAINLMLLGELRLLTSTDASPLILAAVDAACLLALTRLVAGSLGIQGAGFFTLAFFAMVSFNAGASPGMGFETGFVVFLAPSVVFLAAVAWLNARTRRKVDGESASVAYLELGVLTFGFLSGAIRTGGLILHLPAALYAVPAMLAAVAGVSTARAVRPIEKDPRHVLWLQQGGLILSALAFALAIARPQGLSALYSGNTLATALLGLALYVNLLREGRKPAYLYCGFAALLLTYFGAFYFVVDLIHVVEETARRALGYDRKLPLPFKSINALVFNVALAWLSRFFERRWDDQRLVRHCHYIGLPLSVAACVFSCFEPKAAVLCMGGYALLYAVGAGFFRQPKLLYLACLASVGSVFFATTLSGGVSLGMRAELASILGLVFWSLQVVPRWLKAGDSYRDPLIHAARFMAALSLGVATASVMIQQDINRPALAAFGLTAVLAVLNGLNAPRVSVYLLAMASFLGLWIGGFRAWSGDGWALAMMYGLWVAVYAMGLLVLAELVRPRRDRSEAARASLAATIWAVPVVIATAWTLSAWSVTDGWPLVMAQFLGGFALILLTRSVREVALVYLGLAGLAGSAFCATGMVAPWVDRGVGIAWLSVTSAICGLIAWGWGETGRRRAWDSFYVRPCLDMAIALTVAVAALSLGARLESVASYRLGAGALLVGSILFGLLAFSRGRAEFVVGAVAWTVGASYLTLFSLGRSSPDSFWILGFTASVEAVACWGVARLIRWRSRDPQSPYAWALEWSCVGLMAAGVILGVQSPITLVVVALTCVLLVEGIPSALWIHGAIAAVCVAIFQKWLTDVSRSRLTLAVVVLAYGTLGLGVLLRRFGPALRRRLRLEDLPWHVPPFQGAAVLGFLAVLIRVATIAQTGGGWFDSAWLYWSLAILALSLLTYQPDRGLIQLGVILTGLGFVASLAPVLDESGRPWLLGMALSTFLLILGRAASKFEPWLRHRFAWREGSDFAEIVTLWSRWVFFVASTIVAFLVVSTTLGTVLRSTTLIVDYAWRDVLIALGLAFVYLAIEGRRLGDDVTLVGCQAVSLAVVWWLGVLGSPWIDRFSISRPDYFPIATAGLSLVFVTIGLIRGQRSWLLAGFTRWSGFALALIAVGFAILSHGLVGTGTLLMAILALALLALVRGSVESAYAGSFLWCLWVPIAVFQIKRALGFAPDQGLFGLPAVAITTALFVLWIAAGRLRSRSQETRLVVIRAMERVAVGWAVVAACLATLMNGPIEVAGASVLLALAVFAGWLAVRWGREWPVYVAQGLVVVAYFRVRTTLVPSAWADSAVLALLGYLDLGLSELFQRLRLRLFTRPSLRFALVLPLVPLLQSAWWGRGDRVDLFLLLATSGFYALASARLRSKTPSYAAAVLFNGFLWLAWSQMGWRLNDRPQFYLIPVGVTTILFAEVNRRELGRQVVNSLRNLGLVVVYLSLAPPIWQTQDFGAWLTLLLLSLVGILLGIGLRIQSFLWLGLASFVADLTYQIGRLGVDHALARWGVMLALGVILIIFVALNEKKQIAATVRAYYDEARSWD